MPVRIQRILALVSAIGAGTAVIVTLVMTVVITGNVAARKILLVASPYVEEYSGYALVLITYFGLAYTLRTGGHIRVDLVVDRLSPRIRQWLELVTTAACLVTLCYLLPKSIHYTLFSLEMNVRSPFYSQSPMWVLHLLIPIGLGMFILQMAGHLVELVAAIVTGAEKEKMPASTATSGE